jgi:XisH protein
MAKDKYHDIVKTALVKDGWTITNDPLRVEAGDRTVQIDLGAEKLIAAEKGTEKIAVETKSFLGISQLNDFYSALGKYNFYSLALEQVEPDRVLILAVPNNAYKTFFSEAFTKTALERYQVHLLVYNIQDESIVVWEK